MMPIHKGETQPDKPTLRNMIINETEYYFEIWANRYMKIKSPRIILKIARKKIM